MLFFSGVQAFEIRVLIKPTTTERVHLYSPISTLDIHSVQVSWSSLDYMQHMK